MNEIAHPSVGTIAQLLPSQSAPYVVHDIFERIVDGCRSEVAFTFEHGHLLLQAEEDTDSLRASYCELDFEPGAEYRPVHATSFLKRFVHQELGWTWRAVNQQGYSDSVLLSFGGIEPGVLLQAVASSIELYSVESQS